VQFIYIFLFPSSYIPFFLKISMFHSINFDFKEIIFGIFLIENGKLFKYVLSLKSELLCLKVYLKIM